MNLKIKLENLEIMHNIELFLSQKETKYKLGKSIFCHKLDSISSLKNLVEEWDVRKFSLPKIDKILNGEESDEYFNENKSNFNYNQEENVIKIELDKRLILFLPAK